MASPRARSGLNSEGLGQIKRPAILHWNLRHYVVLSDIRGGKLVIHDPARGRRTISLDEASKCFTGVALELTPTPSFEMKPAAEKTHLRDLFSRARGVVTSVLHLFVLALILQLVALLSPLINQMIVDDVLAKGDTYLLAALAIGMLGLLIINQTIAILSGYINMYMGNQLSFQMQTHLLRHVLRLPVSWFEKRRLGDMLSRFNSLAPRKVSLPLPYR